MVGLALCYGKEGFSSWICGLKQTRLCTFRLAFLRIVNTLRFGKSFFFFVLELEMINVWWLMCTSWHAYRSGGMLITLLVSLVLGSPYFEKCEKYIFV
jgi:hypothetical protein